MPGHFIDKLWEGSPGAQTRRERTTAGYRAFVPDPIAEAEFSLSVHVVKVLDRASAAIRHLNESPPRLASLEALARQLLREESLASSRIEGLDIGHRRLALADSEAARSPDLRAADIVGNIRALEQAIAFAAGAQAFQPEVLTEIHRTLLRFGQDAAISGRFRDAQGWIGGINPPNAEYVPPPPEELPRLLDDLCAFVNRDDLPVLAQAAIAHAQFENIHPFADGNGRVGRCLFHAQLRRGSLASRYVPPISLVLAARRKQYFAGLAAFREDRVGEWLESFADAAATAASEAERLAEHIDDLQESWRGRFDAPPRADATVLKVLSVLPAHPVLDIPTVVRELAVSDVAAGQALRRLEGFGIVREMTRRVRGRVWECPELFKLADRFEQDLKSRVG